MPERLHSVSLTDFDTQSAGAELSVAAGGIGLLKYGIFEACPQNLNTCMAVKYRDKFYSNDVVNIRRFNASDITYIDTINLPDFKGFSVFSDGTSDYLWLLFTNRVEKHDGTDLTVPLATYCNSGEVINATAFWIDAALDYIYVYDQRNHIDRFRLSTNAFVDTTANAGNKDAWYADGSKLYTFHDVPDLSAVFNLSDMSAAAPIDTGNLSPQNYSVWSTGRFFKLENYIGMADFAGLRLYNADFTSTVYRKIGQRQLGRAESPLLMDGIVAAGTRMAFFYDEVEKYIYWVSYRPNVAGKFYVHFNRTVHTAAPVITGEADLKSKLGVVNPVYKRLAVQEDADGGEITYYRSVNETDWNEITQASGFDLSGHSASDPLYLKVQLDNLHAKVGSPKIYGIDIIVEGDYIPTLVNDIITVDVKDDLITVDVRD